MIARYSPFTRASWDPFAEMTRLQRAMNRLFETAPNGEREGLYRFPALNLYGNDDEVLVTGELPGVDPKNIDISVHNGLFTISGTREIQEPAEGETLHRQERFSGRFSRTIELPYDVDAEKVKAHLRNGVLHVVLPRAEAHKPRKIAVSSEKA